MFRHNTDIGQNFLRDRGTAAWMAGREGLSGDDFVLEIGPGDGVLTAALLSTDLGRLDVIELDRRLAPALAPLEADGRFTLHWGDAVRFDYSSLGCAPTWVIANLPYHITTPLIWRLLEEFSGRGTKGLLLMLQAETAERLTAGAGSRASCPLGITLAALGSASIARRVPRGSFVPMPRVDSAVAEFIFTGELTDLPRDRAWRRLLSGSFASRRKTLVNNWKGSFQMPREESERLLASIGRPSTARPEELELGEWLAINGHNILIDKDNMRQDNVCGSDMK